MRKGNGYCLVTRRDAAAASRLCFVSLVALFFVAACGGGAPSGEPVPTAATLGDETVLSAAEYLALPPYAGADRQNGRRQAQLCAACHTFEAGGRTMVGPNLHGFFGRVAGTRAGFDYSEVMRQADFVWTPRALDAWLARPGRFLPGNRMSFVGIPDADERADLIAWLLETVGLSDESRIDESGEGAQ